MWTYSEDQWRRPSSTPANEWRTEHQAWDIEFLIRPIDRLSSPHPGEDGRGGFHCDPLHLSLSDLFVCRLWHLPLVLKPLTTSSAMVVIDPERSVAELDAVRRARPVVAGDSGSRVGGLKRRSDGKNLTCPYLDTGSPIQGKHNFG